MITFQTDMRAAAVELLTDFKEDRGILLQVYRARPIHIKTPTAFVESISDNLADFLAPDIFQHVVVARVVVLHGTYDTGDTVDQRDAFVDAFLDWVRTRYHAAGANTLVRIRAVEDDPDYIPTWLPLAEQKPYYASVISVEGEAAD